MLQTHLLQQEAKESMIWIVSGQRTKKTGKKKKKGGSSIISMLVLLVGGIGFLRNYFRTSKSNLENWLRIVSWEYITSYNSRTFSAMSNVPCCKGTQMESRIYS